MAKSFCAHAQLLTQAAPTASVNKSPRIVHSPGRTREAALAVIEEIDEEQQRVFSVAVAGEKHLDTDEYVGKDLFRVVQKLTECTELTRMLREYIDDLAKSAGVQIEVQS